MSDYDEYDDTRTYFCLECHGYTTTEDDILVCEHCQTEDITMVDPDDIPYDIQASYYDDNFGHWNMDDDPDMKEFYFQVQKESVLKECSICGRQVKLRPEYDKCDSCCRQIEASGGW